MVFKRLNLAYINRQFVKLQVLIAPFLFVLHIREQKGDACASKTAQYRRVGSVRPGDVARNTGERRAPSSNLSIETKNKFLYISFGLQIGYHPRLKEETIMRSPMSFKIFLTLIMVAALLTFAGRQAESAKNPRVPDIRTFVTYKYIDPMTGMEAFHLLIPKGWKAQGAIKWSSNPALPAQSHFRFYNPDGAEEFSLYPTQSYFWTDNRMFLGTHPPGSLRFGSRVAKPISLHLAFSDVVIPGSGRNMKSVQIISEKDVPELAKLATGAPAQGVQSFAQGGKMRIEYPEKGRQMEEELYAAVSQFVIHLPASGYSGSYFINYWYIDYVFSFKDEKGKLDSKTKTYQTMLYSMKVNPGWFAKVVNVREMLAQQTMQDIRAVGRIGEMVAKAGSKMREDQQRDWERRQAVQDRIARNFSDHIRGVDRYHDARAGKEVELPSGYGTAWANNLGEYIVTESPSYNPNVDSNQHWEQLTPVR